MAGTGWEGIRVIDILDMASGIGCLEGEEGSYTNPETCYYHFEASLGWVRLGTQDRKNDGQHL
jgi:hypothetical protein